MSYLRQLGQARQKNNMMMVQFDRVVNAFVVPAGVASGEIDDVCAKLNEALAKIRVWLNKKKCNGKYFRIFLMEFSIEYVDRRYDMHNIYDEIGKLEGTDIRPSRTKPAEPFKRPPLRGLWHKHHYRAGFIAKNLMQETELMQKDGRWEAMFAPHYGRYVHEFINQISHEMVFGALERRARDCRLTGEFILYELQPDGSNYYLTLGSHGEYDAIRARVDICKEFDCDNGL